MSHLIGHTLRGEGKAFSGRRCEEGPCASQAPARALGHGTDGAGHGECSCRAQSPHLPTGRARQRWHADHKAQVRARYGDPRAGARYTDRDQRGNVRQVEVVGWDASRCRWKVRAVITVEVDGEQRQTLDRASYLAPETLRTRYRPVEIDGAPADE